MDATGQDHIEKILYQLNGLNAGEALQLLVRAYPGQVTFSTSFSYEDQVVTHLIRQYAPEVSIFTLDTGRLFPETYSVWNRTNEKYGIRVQPYLPEPVSLEKFLAANGPNAFYESVELRKECCYLRKVVPLKRALEGNAVWITGLRAAHSPERQGLSPVEWDEANQVIKYHPVLTWSQEAILDFIRANGIPFNPLHEKGFVSIGCAPCTRAVKPGEDFRAGRWWWEDASKKECGLHLHPSKS